MALDRVLAEQWVYGFIGFIIAHSVQFPLSIVTYAWFVMSWLFVHHVDSFEGQIVFHSLHYLMICIGALCGYFFVKYFCTPLILPLNDICNGWKNGFVYSIQVVGIGAYFIASITDFFNNPSAFPESSDTFQNTIMVISLVIGLIWFLTTTYHLFKTKDGTSFMKYIALLLGVAFAPTVVLASHVAVLIGVTIAIYFTAFLISLFLFRKKDVIFCGKKRTKTLFYFWLWILLFHLPIYIAGNLSSNCFIGPSTDKKLVEENECEVLSSSLNVFATIGIISIAYIVLLCIFLLLRKDKTKKPKIINLYTTKEDQHPIGYQRR